MSDEMPDWNPEEERKRTDPREFAKEAMREAAKIQKELDGENRAERRAVGLGGYVTAPEPASVTLSVRKIRNGWIVVSGAGPYMGGPPIFMDEEYARTPEEAVQAAVRMVGAFVGIHPVVPGA